MGSGFKTFSAGAVLTASEVNNYLMEQSVMYFATTAARDAALGSGVREDGMTVYIGSNNTDEGLYTYNGTSWTRPWNMPWGLKVSALTGAGTATASELIQSSCASTTFYANRSYRWTVSASYTGTVGGDLFQALLRETNTSGTARGQINFTIHPTSAKGSFSISAAFAPGAVTFTPVVTIARVSGSGTANLDLQVHQIIEDIGPSGAPV
jgi:hypothetical protein